MLAPQVEGRLGLLWGDVVVEDLDHFSRFLLDRLLNQAGVADVNSSIVLRTVKAFRGLPLPAGEAK